MKLINNSDNKITNNLKELVLKVQEEQPVLLSEEAIVTEITKTGLATVVVEYQGSINLKDMPTNQEGLCEVYSSTLGDVNITSFSDNNLTLQIYDRA